MKLTIFERQLLKNQHEILEKLTEDEEQKQYHRNMQTVYQRGYEYEYFEYGAESDEYSLSEEDSKFVYEVINMYDDLSYYWNNTQEIKENVDEIDMNFPGFDLNDPFEGRLYSYASYLINDLNKFHETKENVRKGKSLNSHGIGPGVKGYKIMLEKYNKINSERMKRGLDKSFTLEEIEEIIKYY